MSRESLPWRHRANDVLWQLGEVVGCLFVGLLVLFALALVVRYVVAVVEDFRSDPPMDCSDWSPGKMAESPHDLACEAQWDDQLNELNP
jgi:hypothetical protein